MRAASRPRERTNGPDENGSFGHLIVAALLGMRGRTSLRCGHTQKEESRCAFDHDTSVAATHAFEKDEKMQRMMNGEPLRQLLHYWRGRLRLSNGWLVIHLLAAGVIAGSVGWAALR
jgi:hypothetical protein